jgi:hypothetical protein
MRFAVVMRKQAIDNPWVSHRWLPVEVFADSGQFDESGVPVNTPNAIGRFIERDAEGETWLFRGFGLDLFPDEAEGYFLNATAAEPCWFVMWRLEEDDQRFLDPASVAQCGTESTLAIPHRICLSGILHVLEPHQESFHDAQEPTYRSSLLSRHQSIHR